MLGGWRRPAVLLLRAGPIRPPALARTAVVHTRPEWPHPSLHDLHDGADADADADDAFLARRQLARRQRRVVHARTSPFTTLRRAKEQEDSAEEEGEEEGDDAKGEEEEERELMQGLEARRKQRRQDIRERQATYARAYARHGHQAKTAVLNFMQVASLSPSPPTAPGTPQADSTHGQQRTHTGGKQWSWGGARGGTRSESTGAAHDVPSSVNAVLVAIALPYLVHSLLSQPRSVLFLRDHPVAFFVLVWPCALLYQSVLGALCANDGIVREMGLVLRDLAEHRAVRGDWTDMLIPFTISLMEASPMFTRDLVAQGVLRWLPSTLEAWGSQLVTMPSVRHAELALATQYLKIAREVLAKDPAAKSELSCAVLLKMLEWGSDMDGDFCVEVLRCLEIKWQQGCEMEIMDSGAVQRAMVLNEMNEWESSLARASGSFLCLLKQSVPDVRRHELFSLFGGDANRVRLFEETVQDIVAYDHENCRYPSVTDSIVGSVGVLSGVALGLVWGAARGLIRGRRVGIPSGDLRFFAYRCSIRAALGTAGVVFLWDNLPRLLALPNGRTYTGAGGTVAMSRQALLVRDGSMLFAFGVLSTMFPFAVFGWLFNPAHGYERMERPEVEGAPRRDS